MEKKTREAAAWALSEAAKEIMRIDSQLITGFDALEFEYRYYGKRVRIRLEIFDFIRNEGDEQEKPE